MAVRIGRAIQRGFSLVELTITVAVVCVMAGSALPMMHDMLMQRALAGRSAELGADLQFARNQALARNTGVRISFQEGVGGSCYVVHSGAAQACSCGAATVSNQATTAAVCRGDAQAFKMVHLPAQAAVQIHANVASVLFDPALGTSSPTTTVHLTDKRGRSIDHIVNLMGRVRSCASSGTVPGVAAC